MFEPSATPRVFGVSPGTDFPRALIDGLRAHLEGQPPEAMARVELIVNTRRMQRRLKDLFDAGPGGFLPNIRLVTEFGRNRLDIDVPQPVSALRRRLELSQLVGKLLDQEPKLAPRSSIYDLADSLARLLEEMDGEGVAPEVLRALDVTDQSGHWQRALAFVQLIEPFFAGDLPGAEAVQRRIAGALSELWQVAPPEHPIILAGSTGSRGATSVLMQAVAKLPQGAVVLPGFDFDMTATAWSKLSQRMTGEDHPQFRFAKLARDLEIDPKAIERWTGDAPPHPQLNRLISLSLRPAPVTDQWLSEGQTLRDLPEATASLTLIEAESPRAEANALAVMLRGAAESGQRAALISPNRQLTRQVAAALDRWGILPDESAGQPLLQSTPGRLLRQVAQLFGRKLTADALLALLKHPLVASDADRGPHLLETRELELWLRRRGPAFVTPQTIEAFAATRKDAGAWAAWLCEVLNVLADFRTHPLSAHLDQLVRLTEALCAWPNATGSGALWESAAGIEAQKVITELRAEAEHGGVMGAQDFADLFSSVLDTGMVLDAVSVHPDIMIWGPLEARVHGAELVILAGLNEGSWPPSPKPDPWLNRAMREKAGLLLPEREIGLSAHDYQQAVCTRSVVLSRSIRDAEAQTVSARWINRLCNLLEGLGAEGEAALGAMRARGAAWLSHAAELERPLLAVSPAPRPAPQPPIEARPTQISITEVQRLIRDPYAVYARRVLGLSALDPLRKTPDAPLRGTVFHKIFERFVAGELSGELVADRERLLQIAEQVFDVQAGWPAARRLWRARILRLADWFVTTEYARRAAGRPLALEKSGSLNLGEVETVLGGKIDRIDLLESGALAIYDYKTGAVPSNPVQKHFDKQLPLSALLAEQGVIEGLARHRVSQVGFIGLGAKLVFDPQPFTDAEVAEVRAELLQLLAAFRVRSRGYTSRRAVDQTSYEGDYDHLARYGEWSESSPPHPEEVG